MRLKTYVTNPTGKRVDPTLPYLSLEDLEGGRGRLLEGVELDGKVTDDSVLHQPGDVRFGKLRPYLSKSYLAEAPGVGSAELLVLRPALGMDPRFLWYLTLSQPFLDWAVATSYGVKMPRTSWRELADFDLDLPSLEEQRRRVRFLDAEIAAMDVLREEQLTFMSLLQERRAALVTSALAGSLSKNSALTDSGVPWIGSIPSHWEVKRLKHVGRSTIGLTFDPIDVVPADEGGTLVLRAGNVQEDQVVFGDDVYVRTPIPPQLRTREGDILICVRNGSVRLIGKNAVISNALEGLTWGAFMAVFRSPMNAYLSWVLRSSIFSQQLGLFTTSTINQLTNTTLHNFQVPVPPLEERADIIAHLNQASEEIGRLIAETRIALSIADERRQALISEVVTGRMEVA